MFYRYCYRPRHIVSKCFKLQSKEGTGWYNHAKFKSDKTFAHPTFVVTIDDYTSSNSSAINKFCSQIDLNTLKQALT